MLGTAAYMSPEQAMGEAATAASDRYALAVVAYELLAGTRPFEAEHFAAQARAHVEDPLPPAVRAPRTCRPRLTPCSNADWPRRPADRWASARRRSSTRSRQARRPPRPDAPADAARRLRR